MICVAMLIRSVGQGGIWHLLGVLEASKVRRRLAFRVHRSEKDNNPFTYPKYLR